MLLFRQTVNLLGYIFVVGLGAGQLQKLRLQLLQPVVNGHQGFIIFFTEGGGDVVLQSGEETTDDIDSKLEELQQQLLIQAKSKNDYEDVTEEIYRLRELKQNALVENAEREGKRQRIAEMTDLLNEQSCELEEYDEQLVRRLIEKVTVHDDRIEVKFKSSIENRKLDIRLAAD